MQRYKFSIITPVYNREDCIARCIESVRHQQYENWEHIVVDDGSSDGTDHIVRKLSQEIPQLKYIKQEKNQGTNAARNAALEKVTGDFVVFLDSDDFLADNALSEIADVISRNSVYEYFLFAVSDRQEYYATHPLLGKQRETEILYPNWLTGVVTGDFVHVVSSDIWKKNRFYTKYRIYEELTFMELYKQTSKQLFSNIVVICRERNRKDSVTHEASLYKRNSILFSKEVLAKILDSHFQGYLDSGEKKSLQDKLNKLYLYTLMLGLYQELPAIERQMELCEGKIVPLYRCLKFARLGVLFSWGVRSFSFIKHQIKD